MASHSATLSDLAKDILAKQKSACEALIQNILPTICGTTDEIIAVDFAFSNLKHHTYIETNSFAVERDVEEIEEKLETHAQEWKAARLRKLVNHLSTIVPEWKHDYLRLLLLLSIRPTALHVRPDEGGYDPAVSGELNSDLDDCESAVTGTNRTQRYRDVDQAWVEERFSDSSESDEAEDDGLISSAASSSHRPSDRDTAVPRPQDNEKPKGLSLNLWLCRRLWDTSRLCRPSLFCSLSLVFLEQHFRLPLIFLKILKGPQVAEQYSAQNDSAHDCTQAGTLGGLSDSASSGYRKEINAPIKPYDLGYAFKRTLFTSDTTAMLRPLRYPEHTYEATQQLIQDQLPQPISTSAYSAREGDIVRAILHMFLGCDSDLFVMGDGCFSLSPVAKRLYISHLSGKCLQSTLLDFLRHANEICALRQFAELAVQGSTTSLSGGPSMHASERDHLSKHIGRGFCKFKNGIDLGLSVRALGISLKEILTEFDVKITKLEKSMFCNEETLALRDVEVLDPTIIALRREVSKSMPIFRRLYLLIEEIEQGIEKALSAREFIGLYVPGDRQVKPNNHILVREMTARILSSIYAAAERSATSEGIGPVVCPSRALRGCFHEEIKTTASCLDHCGIFSVLYKIFCDAARPYIQLLGSWMAEGQIEDSFGESFLAQMEPHIVGKEKVPQLRVERDVFSGEDAVPTFLKEWEHQIWDAGLSICMLRVIRVSVAAQTCIIGSSGAKEGIKTRDGADNKILLARQNESDGPISKQISHDNLADKQQVIGKRRASVSKDGKLEGTAGVFGLSIPSSTNGENEELLESSINVAFRHYTMPGLEVPCGALCPTVRDDDDTSFTFKVGAPESDTPWSMGTSVSIPHILSRKQRAHKDWCRSKSELVSSILQRTLFQQIGELHKRVSIDLADAFRGNLAMIVHFRIIRSWILMTREDLLSPLRERLFAHLDCGDVAWADSRFLSRLLASCLNKENAIQYFSLELDNFHCQYRVRSPRSGTNEPLTCESKRRLTVNLERLLRIEEMQRYSSKLSLRLKPSPMSSNMTDVGVLEMLKMSYCAEPPLSFILDEEVLDKYNALFVFLLQIKWAKASIEQIHHKLRRSGNVDRITSTAPGKTAANCEIPPRRQNCDSGSSEELAPTSLSREAAVLVSQRQRLNVIFGKIFIMTHTVNVLHSYVMNEVTYSGWSAMEKGVNCASNIHEIHMIHRSYLNRICDRCFLSPKGKIVLQTIRMILNLVLKFRDLCIKLLRKIDSIFCASHQMVGHQDRAKLLHINEEQRRDFEQGSSLEAIERELSSTWKSVFEISDRFSAASRYLLIILSAMVRTGGAAHLQELSLVLNFNEYFKTSRSGE